MFYASIKGLELLYQPEVVRLYLSLLTCSHNHNTLEAAAGALQNLAAGHWAVSGWNSFLAIVTLHCGLFDCGVCPKCKSCLYKAGNWSINC